MPGTPNHNPAIIIPIEKPRGRFCLPRIVVTLLYIIFDFYLTGKMGAKYATPLLHLNSKLLCVKIFKKIVSYV